MVNHIRNMTNALGKHGKTAQLTCTFTGVNFYKDLGNNIEINSKNVAMHLLTLPCCASELYKCVKMNHIKLPFLVQLSFYFS